MKNIIRTFIEYALLGVLILGGIATISIFIERQVAINRAPGNDAALQGYPPPQPTIVGIFILPTPEATGLAYPPPQPTPAGGTVYKITRPPVVTQPTPTIGDPVEATRIAAKLSYTPSAAQIVAAATEMALIGKSTYVPPPPPTPVYYPIRSVEDFARVVYNDPFFGNLNGEFGPCLRASQPGNPVFVKSLNVNEIPDYYMMPFFKEGKVCGLYLIEVINGNGTIWEWSEGRGTQYPPVSAAEAKTLVENKTGQEVLGEPQLGFRLLRESYSLHFPLWVVSTADGQTYYVIYKFGSTEAGNTEELTVNVWNANEVHPIRP